MKYKDSYFLHIAKTGGRYFRKNILSSVNPPSRFDYDFKNRVNHNGNSHAGWSEYITEDTYIMSTWRDPAKRCLSEYAYEHPSPTLKEFFSTLEKLNSSKATNAKFTINSQSRSHYIQGSTKKSDAFEILDLSPSNRNDFESFYKKQVERVNFRVRIDDVSKNRIKIIKHLKSQFSIPQDFEVTQEVPYIEWMNPDSKRLWNQLTESDKEYIYKSNHLDLEIWNDDKYFWSPN